MVGHTETSASIGGLGMSSKRGIVSSGLCPMPLRRGLQVQPDTLSIAGQDLMIICKAGAFSAGSVSSSKPCQRSHAPVRGAALKCDLHHGCGEQRSAAAGVPSGMLLCMVTAAYKGPGKGHGTVRVVSMLQDGKQHSDEQH